MNFLVVLFAKPNHIKRSAVIWVMGLCLFTTCPARLPCDGFVLERIAKDDLSSPSDFVGVLPFFGRSFVSFLALWGGHIRFVTSDAMLSLLLVTFRISLF